MLLEESTRISPFSVSGARVRRLRPNPTTMMRMAPLFVNGQQSAAREKDPRLAGMVRAAKRVSPFRII